MTQRPGDQMSEADASCCGPGRPGDAPPTRAVSPLGDSAAPGEGDDDMVAVPGGAFRYGCDRREGHPADGEGPSRVVELAAFRIDRYAVSNVRFARFVDATGYVTDAERAGWSFVFAGLLPDDFEETRGVAGAPWWRQV